MDATAAPEHAQPDFYGGRSFGEDLPRSAKYRLFEGEYFVSAVVIAENERQAIDRILDYLSEYDDVLFDESRVKAMETGVLTRRPDLKGLGMNQAYLATTELLALEIGEDYDF